MRSAARPVRAAMSGAASSGVSVVSTNTTTAVRAFTSAAVPGISTSAAGSGHAAAVAFGLAAGAGLVGGATLARNDTEPLPGGAAAFKPVTTTNLGDVIPAPPASAPATAPAPAAAGKVHDPAGAMTLARVMLPADANPAGNVHGGTILQLIEQAAAVAASRHANSCPGEAQPDERPDGSQRPSAPLWAALARVEHMDFRQPMHVGELARAQARVVYASPHSMAVSVRVWAEDYIKGTTRVTNDALLWLVALHPFNPRTERPTTATVPAIPRPAGNTGLSRAWDMAHAVYSNRTSAPPSAEAAEVASGAGLGAGASGLPVVPDDAHTPDDDATELSQLMLPSDSVDAHLVSGGVIMKLMDNAAGITAVRHCGTNVVTVCVDEIDFQAPVSVGNLVHIRARPVFVSNRSMEIEVTVEVTQMGGNGSAKQVATTKQALFTFVSLDKHGRPLPMPPLKVATDADRKKWEEGRARYERRRRQRAQLKKLKAAATKK